MLQEVETLIMKVLACDGPSGKRLLAEFEGRKEIANSLMVTEQDFLEHLLLEAQTELMYWTDGEGLEGGEWL